MNIFTVTKVKTIKISVKRFYDKVFTESGLLSNICKARYEFLKFVNNVST